jgi:hypothetical protein
MEAKTTTWQAAVAAVIVTKKFDEDAAGPPNARHCEPAHLSFSCVFSLLTYISSTTEGLHNASPTAFSRLRGCN